ncbi:MAG: PadR family transcriptional regulator [Lachnospiraceae bacterium]|nr:PadR family transcriptional regulator [Lachnospiraceae bacterium]
MGRESVESSLIMEMRRGTIVLVVLYCLDEPVYGYSLVEELARKGVPVEANTLYPLLRRLSSQGLLDNRWDTSNSKPRKYYVITEKGRELREKLREQWNVLSEAVFGIVGGSK